MELIKGIEEDILRQTEREGKRVGETEEKGERSMVEEEKKSKKKKEEEERVKEMIVYM